MASFQQIREEFSKIIELEAEKFVAKMGRKFETLEIGEICKEFLDDFQMILQKDKII